MLGEKSEQEMIDKMQELPEDLQSEIIDKMEEKGMKIPEELQKGIKKTPKPAVEVEVDDQGTIQHKLNGNLINVHGSVDVDVNTTPEWKIQQELQNKLNRVFASVNLSLNSIFGRAEGGVFANGRWQPIQAYANGGLPSGGQLFMAREAGPELVGKIGRHTAVMNNNQIVDSVKAGVYEAVSAAMSSANLGGIELVAHTDEGVVIDRINRITRQTGSCPIEI